MTGGETGCRCNYDLAQLRGPYIIVWTRKVQGKTVTRVLSQEQLADYQPWLDDARKLRTLLIELQELTLHVVDEGDRWQRR